MTNDPRKTVMPQTYGGDSAIGRCILPVGIALVLLVCAALPFVLGAVERPDPLLALTARTADGPQTPGTRFPVSQTLGVHLHITSASGTSPTLNLWLQTSCDDGATWTDLPYAQQMTSSASGADVTLVTGKRNVNGSSAATAAGDFFASYAAVPCDWIRAQWDIGGTDTPTFTFAVYATGKGN